MSYTNESAEKGNPTANDYAEALQVQDACNLSGVVFAWARVMEKICNECRDKGTDAKNGHAINVLFASKVASLTGCEIGLNFHHAYDKASDMSKA